MRLIPQSVFALMTATFALFCLPHLAYAREITAEQLRAHFARYVSVGKGNTEIHISIKGYTGIARTRDNEDGTYTCIISGLGIKEEANEVEVLLEMKGKFIHEYTHCLVAPYYNTSFEKPININESVARDMVQLTQEGISDTRSLVELYRKDGLLVAEEYARFMMKKRMDAGKILHKTARAITCARDVIRNTPELLASDEQAFAIALACGKSGAWKTLTEALTANGLEAIMEDDLLKSTKSDIDAGELRALTAFTSGRYRNNAITIRLSFEEYAKGDHHVFIREDGGVETVLALGSEGAVGLVELQSLITSSVDPVHLLAVTALRKQGRLSVRSLRITSGHFNNFVHIVTRKMPEQETRVRRIIEEVITESQVGEGMDSIFNEASKRIQREFKI